VLEASDIFIGVNAQCDYYSGYPDCRPKFIHAFSKIWQMLGNQSRASKGAHPGQDSTRP
jgi:7-cyano-7-deazaguanine synthase